MSALEIPMTETEAKQTTARIKLLVSTITETIEKTVLLIERAEAGRAWEILGYTSWTAYVAGEFAESLAGLARAERIPIVAKLSGTGMSTRAIGEVVGVSHKTVVGDLRAGGTGGTTSTGTDGKTYPRPATFLASGRPDAATVEEFGRSVPRSPRKSPRRPLPVAYRAAVHDLEKSIERLARLTADDRFASNVDDLYTANGDPLARLQIALHDAVVMPLVRGGRR